MKNTLLATLSVLSLFVFPALAHAQEARLIKGEIGNPAAYMRKIRTVPRRGRGPVVFEKEEYDFEKTEASNTLRDSGLTATGDFSTIRPEVRLKSKRQFVFTAPRQINNGLANEGGPDPMLAVGEKTVLVANTTWIKFFDKKSGDLLYATDANGMFSIFLSPDSPQYASNFYDVPRDVPYFCTKDGPCDKPRPIDPLTGKRLPCNERTDEGLIQSAYDVRVIFQKENRRFVIVAALKNNTSRDNNHYNKSGARDCKRYLIRLVGIAVSNSENPNDGFKVYRTHENNYRDWPNVVADQDYLVLAHRGGGVFSEGTSIVSVYSFTDLRDSTTEIHSFRIKQVRLLDNSPVAVMPVTNLITNDSAIFFVEHAAGSLGQIKIWYIKKPSNPVAIFDDPPTELRAAGGQLTVAGANFSGGNYAGVTYFDDNIYTVSHQEFFPSSSLLRKGYGLNVFRIPVHPLSNGGYEATTVNLKREVFKHENYSYQSPSLAIDPLKNIAIQFVRIPRHKHSVEKPEIRSKVKFLAKTEWQDSQLVKEWTVAHDDKKLVDYSWIVRDPFDITSFWHAHRLRRPTKSMWIGKINMNSQ